MHKSSGKNAFSNKRVAERINRCVEKLIEAFAPEKIILFGSYARGQAGGEGTIDLLIIADTDLKFFERIKKAVLSCSGGFPSIEPIIYTPQEFNTLLDHGEGFVEDAIEEGKVVYSRESAGNRN